MEELLENKKPLVIVLAALAGIIVITVAVALILRVRGGERFAKNDVPYPYSWEEKKNGTITLTMERGKAAGGAWSLGSTEGDAVEAGFGKTGEKTKVKLTPTSPGRETMTFVLVSGEERLAELNVTVAVELVDNALATTVISHRERALQSTVRGGEETGHPFTVRGGDDGLTIFVEDSEGYTDDGSAWASDSTNSMVAFVSAIEISDTGVTIRLETRANGTAEVRAYSIRDNISFVFDVEVADGEMLLTDSRSEPYETVEETAENPENEPMA